MQSSAPPSNGLRTSTDVKKKGGSNLSTTPSSELESKMAFPFSVALNYPIEPTTAQDALSNTFPTQCMRAMNIVKPVKGNLLVTTNARSSVPPSPLPLPIDARSIPCARNPRLKRRWLVTPFGLKVLKDEEGITMEMEGKGKRRKVARNRDL